MRTRVSAEKNKRTKESVSINTHQQFGPFIPSDDPNLSGSHQNPSFIPKRQNQGPTRKEMNPSEPMRGAKEMILLEQSQQHLVWRKNPEKRKWRD